MTKELKSLNHQHHLVAYLAASGMNATNIAKRVDLSPTTIQNYLKDTTIQELIREERTKICGSDIEEAIRKSAPSALETVKEIMTDDDNKAGTRLTAANSLLDRSLGKAIQRTEEVSHTIRDLFQMLDKSKIGFAPLPQQPDESVTSALKEVKSENSIPKEISVVEVNSEVDNWVKENIDDEIYRKPTGCPTKVQESRAQEVGPTQSKDREPPEHGQLSRTEPKTEDDKT